MARVMREKALRVDVDGPLLDTCGTGGDGKATFNVSTAAAFVAAGAGARVAKHGNRAASSACGSADVLEALGATIELSPEGVAGCIERTGFGFMFAPSHHPAMRHAAPVRRELAARTVFNVLGPLTNPAGARAQVVGVYAPELVRTIAEVLLRLGAERAFVVHGADGIDELSPAGPNLVCEVLGGKVRKRNLDPLELGIPRCAPEELRGGSADENAAAIQEIFAGADGGRRDAVLLNAAAAIAAGGHVKDLREGLGYAREAIDRMLRIAGCEDDSRAFSVCDVGAGVGHLTIPLARRGLRVVADPAVPYTETLRLAAARPARTRVVLVGLVQHVQGSPLAPGWRGAGELLSMWTVVYGLIAAG
jgi:anthranilate phosphoribosyltransferase